MIDYRYIPRKCPEHEGEHLRPRTLIIKTIDDEEGMGYPTFEYCEKSDKYFDGKKLVGEKEIALQRINNLETNKKKYSLEEITVTIPQSA